MFIEIYFSSLNNLSTKSCSQRSRNYFCFIVRSNRFGTRIDCGRSALTQYKDDKRLLRRYTENTIVFSFIEINCFGQTATTWYHYVDTTCKEDKHVFLKKFSSINQRQKINQHLLHQNDVKIVPIPRESQQDEKQLESLVERINRERESVKL